MQGRFSIQGSCIANFPNYPWSCQNRSSPCDSASSQPFSYFPCFKLVKKSIREHRHWFASPTLFLFSMLQTSWEECEGAPTLICSQTISWPSSTNLALHLSIKRPCNWASSDLLILHPSSTWNKHWLSKMRMFPRSDTQPIARFAGRALMFQASWIGLGAGNQMSQGPENEVTDKLLST